MHFIVIKSVVSTNFIGSNDSYGKYGMDKMQPTIDDDEIGRCFDTKYTIQHALIMLIAMCICDDKLNDWNENKRNNTPK